MPPRSAGRAWLPNQAPASARDAAEAASRAKSAFLANTSHEIRTPLNGLLGLARLAMQEDLLDSRRQQYLNQIFDSAQSLSSIISDILDVMMIVVAMLEHWGVRVAQAQDGLMAVEAVHHAVSQGDPFDAVLMDVQMPVMSGHEAARELRRHYAAQHLPILALTAAALVSERDDAMRAGMNDFLTKPIDAPKLRQSLARHVRAQAAEPLG